MTVDSESLLRLATGTQLVKAALESVDGLTSSERREILLSLAMYEMLTSGRMVLEALDAIRARGVLIDRLEAAFAACEHPYAKKVGGNWCNLCGAMLFEGGGAAGKWLQPHYRQILVVATH